MIFSRDLFKEVFLYVFLYEANCKHGWHSFPRYLLSTTWPWFNCCNINSQKNHEEFTSPCGTHVRMCTHLALKSYVAIYELAISRVSQYSCMTQPGGTEWLDIAWAFTPWTWLQHGAVYRRLLLYCWAACIHWGMLAQIPVLAQVPGGLWGIWN